jgi:DNA-binding MarR family transcriptional regulator
MHGHEETTKDSGDSGSGKVSRNEPDKDLLPFARQVGRELRLRAKAMPQINESRWMILLDVYLAMGQTRDTPFMSAAHASNVAVSTAQRHIHEMIASGLIAQRRSGQDQRITHIRLTDDGLRLVGKMLGEIRRLRARS